MTEQFLIAVLSFPAFDPVAVAIGPFAIRWYALAYIGGLLLGWQYVRWLARRGVTTLTAALADDLLLGVALGVVLGGRLGYILFYRPEFYFTHPTQILAVWQGGMSFHGGLLGVLLVIVLFARRHQISVFTVSDPLAVTTPIGLLFGRVANFVNGELYGRVSDLPWAMVFPTGGPEPRHPSQLYQAALEGLVLFAVMHVLARHSDWARSPGRLTGLFLVGYAIARLIGEVFREPDAHIGFLFAGATMGQMLSLPLLIAGLWLTWRARAKA